MKHLDQRCPSVDKPRAHLKMDFDARQKARSRTVASNGEVVGVHIERGTSLKDGDCLTGEDGEVFMVSAESEPLSVVACDDLLDLARAAYHLGNRHVRLQIEPGRLSYQSDHVLDDMVEQMGFSVKHLMLPFEPEPGAYHRHGHGASQGDGGHSHAHTHSHSHAEAHSHTHSHEEGHSHSHSHAGGQPHSHGEGAHHHHEAHDCHHHRETDAHHHDDEATEVPRSSPRLVLPK